MFENLVVEIAKQDAELEELRNRIDDLEKQVEYWKRTSQFWHNAWKTEEQCHDKDLEMLKRYMKNERILTKQLESMRKSWSDIDEDDLERDEPKFWVAPKKDGDKK